MSKPRRRRSCVDFNSPPRRLSQERLEQAALRTTQSILVVDVKEKHRSGCPRSDFLEGGWLLGYPPFVEHAYPQRKSSHGKLCENVRLRSRVTYGDASGALTLTALR